MFHIVIKYGTHLETSWLDLCVTSWPPQTHLKAGSRKIPSSPSSARSPLAILEQLQSKTYVFLGAAKLLQKSGLRFKMNIQLIQLINNFKCSYVATGDSLRLQEP